MMDDLTDKSTIENRRAEEMRPDIAGPSTKGTAAVETGDQASKPEAPADLSSGALENTALFAKWRKYQAKKKESAAQRRHTRHECSALGVMAIVNRSITMEGIVTEISQGGIKFRPATTYLLNRNGTQVSVTFSTIRVTGKIVATRPDGYGIALFEELDDALIEDFLRVQTELEAA